MKKISSLIAVSLLSAMMFAATSVTFTSADFDGMGTFSTGSDVTVVKDGVTFSCDKAYGNSFALRCYNNSVITITSASDTIQKLMFTFDSQNGTTYNGGLPTEVAVNALNWTNTAARQIRFKKIIVVLGKGEYIPDPTPTTFDTLTCAQAADSAAAGVTKAFAIKGYVTEIVEPWSSYKNVSFWMADTQGTAHVFKAFRVKCETAADAPAVNDLVAVVGSLKKYTKEGQADIYETQVDGTFTILQKNGTTIIPDTSVDTLTVAEALEKGATLPNSGDVTEKNYCVIGYVTSIKTAYNDTYKNMSFYMADNASDKGTFQAYRAKMAAPGAKVGDKVALIGKIRKYVQQSGTATFEISNGTATIIETSAEAEEITVAKALEIGGALAASGDKTPVRYTVVGYVSNIATNGEFNEQYGNESFYMTDEKGIKEGYFKAYRATIAAPGAAIGDKVAVTGYIEKYVGQSSEGSAYTSIQISRGQAEVISHSAVENVTIDETAVKRIENGQLVIIRNGVRYNAQGAVIK